MLGDVKNENKAYTYTLYAPGSGRDAVEVTGKLPQEWLVSVGSSWDGNAAGDTIKELGDNAGGLFGAAGNIATNVGGSNVGFTALANRQWTGGKPLTFNLLAEFNAYENTLEDVIRPVTLLQSMAMPTTEGTVAGGNVSLGNIIGPPYWENAKESGGQVGGKSNIILRVGTMFVFDDVIVEDVNLTQQMKLTNPGLPIKISAEIQVSTRGPITFEQYVSYMTGEALRELFSKGDRIQAAREAGPGQRAGYSGMKPTAPTR